MQEAINGLAEADRPQVFCSASAVGKDPAVNIITA